MIKLIPKFSLVLFFCLILILKGSGLSTVELTFPDQILLGNELTIESSICNGELPEGVQITLIGNDSPYYSFFDISDTSGVVIFDSVVDGSYNLFAYKPGYESYEHLNLQVSNNMHYSIVLDAIHYPIRNLVIDSLTSHISWESPAITKLQKTEFEYVVFPPYGWQSTTLGDGWYRSDNGGTGSWTVPPGDGFYALSNDNAGGISNDGSNDYLITPLLDLSDCESFQLKYDYFFTGDFDQKAYIEYSTDNGITWEIIQSMVPVTDWTEVYIDLTFLSGPGSQPILLAFHADDNGEWASGWAIDNVEISNYPIFLLGYYIYLDDIFVAQVPSTITSYTFVDLTYGEYYYASVAALYACGLSDKVGVIMESSYLHPPRNLTDNHVFGTDSIPLMWNPPMMGTIPGVAAYNIIYIGPPEKAIGSTLDAADEITIIDFQDKSNRYMGELQFSFPDLVGVGEAGCETDGEFIYTVLPNSFVKYNLVGDMVEQFTIPGVSNIKDLTFDGEFFYGAAADPTIFVMDFNNHTLITTFTAPTDVRAIAFSNTDNTFYANNWGTDIVNFDASGTFISSFSPSVSAIYGLAFDNWSIQGLQSLWAYDQGENNLIQFALPTGEPTGFVIDVECQTCSTGLAGGLFTYPGLFEEGKITIGGNVQEQEVWGIELADYNTNVGLIPGGLIDFNVYMDSAYIGGIPYENQSFNEWVYCLIDNVSPGQYECCVSANYDLSIYGFPGEYGESQLICHNTTVWGSAIPFTETWESGTLDNWELNENHLNWSINFSEGEPAPSAQFSWEPLLENNYTSTITSQPILIEDYTEGQIYLDFDLKLIDRNSTGNEKLLVEVYNGITWSTVVEFANNGKIGFQSNHIDLSNFTTGNTIKIRFNVTGNNSYDIEAWLLDNISVTKQCRSPLYLTGNYKWNSSDDMGIELCWTLPDTTSYNSTYFGNNKLSVDATHIKRDIDGFNIYRKQQLSGNYILYDFVDTQPGQELYCYFDAYPNVNQQSGYYYQVTAVYSSEYDNCESEPANALEIPEDDFVYVFVTSTNFFNDKKSITIFPNPTNNVINISSKSAINNVSLIDFNGISVGDVCFNSDTEAQIFTDLLPSGIYILKIKTKTNNVNSKIVLYK